VLPLPAPALQAERLIALGVPEVAGLSAAVLREAAAAAGPRAGALLVVHPALAPASRLTPLVVREGRPAFVVVDLTDVDSFAPIEQATPPAGPVYLVDAVDRGTRWPTGAPTRPFRRSPPGAGRRSPSPRACTGCSSSPRRWNGTTAS
jgi:hypothetical protein